MCRLDDTKTAKKSHNIQDIKELCKSFFSIKSPNNIEYRYRFFRKVFGIVGSFFIVMSMTLNAFVKYIFRKFTVLLKINIQ